jgi:hypothetical protein
MHRHVRAQRFVFVPLRRVIELLHEHATARQQWWL